MSFDITFSNVLLTLLYILPGFIICKMGKVSTEHQSSLSGVLVYACSPCMLISSFLSLDYSAQNALNMGLFFVVTLVLQAGFKTLYEVVVYPLTRVVISQVRKLPDTLPAIQQSESTAAAK